MWGKVSYLRKQHDGRDWASNHRPSDLAPVVQKLDSAIHRINHYPVDNAIGFPITYPLDSDLSGG